MQILGGLFKLTFGIFDATWWKNLLNYLIWKLLLKTAKLPEAKSVVAPLDSTLPVDKYRFTSYRGSRSETKLA